MILAIRWFISVLEAGRQDPTLPEIARKTKRYPSDLTDEEGSGGWNR